MDEYKRKNIRRSSRKSKPPKIKNEDNSIFFDDEDKEEITREKPKKVKRVNAPEKAKPEKDKVREKTVDTDNIPDVPVDKDGRAYKRRKFNVIKTVKSKKNRKKLIFTAALLLVAGTVALLSFLLPTGIIESVSNFADSLGGGDYPIEYNGSLISDSVRMGSCNFLLNDTSVTVYNNNGKLIFKHPHGFTKPVMCVAQARALVFDQGGNTAFIYNLSGLCDTVRTDSEIINACIGRNGAYAVSCVGSEYTSTVTVFSKKGKKLYTWNSAKDIVNAVALSPGGKNLAVSCLNVSNGLAVSKMCVLEYSSADPIFTKELGSNVILSLRSNTWGLACVTEEGYDYFSWRNFSEKDHSVKDKKLSMYRSSGNETLLVFNRENDKSDNTVAVVSSFGNDNGKFKYNDVITDIQYKSGRIYIISDTKVSVYDTDGELISTALCDYGVKRFYVRSSDRLALITDDMIKELVIE